MQIIAEGKIAAEKGKKSEWEAAYNAEDANTKAVYADRSQISIANDINYKMGMI